MFSKKVADRILRYEVAAMTAIVALSWANELFDVPHFMFGSAHHGDWRESALETLIAVFVFIPVFIATKRVVASLHEVERFSRVCSWCKKIHYNGEWISMEDYLRRGLASDISHGICPICSEKHFGDIGTR
ncbi:MAG: hypothetical protein WC378_07105 [Opitutaceae bacterium]|jgi:hypothetical protein